MCQRGSSLRLGWAPIATIVAWLTALPQPALAHGLGGRSDLPVPLGYAVAGALSILVVTFVALIRLWPQPRMQEPPILRPIHLPAWRLIAGALRGLGIIGLLVLVVAGLFGSDNSVRNPAPVLMWVGFWLIVPFASAVLGDLYRLMNPWEPLVSWTGRSASGRAWPASIGLWPALVLFVGFVWLELIYPRSAEPRTVAVAVLLFGLLLTTVADRWEGGLEGLDPFRTYNRLISAIAPIELDRMQGPRWRGWLRGLPLLPSQPGLTVFVIAMIGTVTYDGLSATTWYDRTFDSFGISMAGGSLLLLATGGLLGLAYAGACWAAARQAGEKWTTTAVAQRFAHTLVPIAFAYAFAHYFTLVIFEGQLLLSTISDPFGRGWDLFGTARRSVDFTILSPYSIWWVQLTAIVLGHVAGVVLAHDRALFDFRGAKAVRSQYVMLALMILLTTLGLVILATS
ncbi:MAG: hypothetical protein ACRDVK_02410 [Acidimicrobiia bacterium]